MRLTWAEQIEEKGRLEGKKEGLLEGKKEGLLEGKREGLLEGKREALLRQLTAKFGPLHEATAARVQAIDSSRELDHQLDRVLGARSLSDMGLGD